MRDGQPRSAHATMSRMREVGVGHRREMALLLWLARKATNNRSHRGFSLTKAFAQANPAPIRFVAVPAARFLALSARSEKAHRGLQVPLSPKRVCRLKSEKRSFERVDPLCLMLSVLPGCLVLFMDKLGGIAKRRDYQRFFFTLCQNVDARLHFLRSALAASRASHRSQVRVPKPMSRRFPLA